jgi:single-strand DNA-binding protein
MQSIAITVIGNLVRDPESRGNGSVTKMRIASTERINDGSEWRDGDTAFFDVACFKTLGENVLSYLKKGDKVVVHGKLKYREFERKTGERAHDYEIFASEVGMSLSKKKKTETKVKSTKESAWTS